VAKKISRRFKENKQDIENKPPKQRRTRKKKTDQVIKNLDLDEWHTTFEERQSLINEIDTILEDIKEDQNGNIGMSSPEKKPHEELEIKQEKEEVSENLNELKKEQDDTNEPSFEKKPLKKLEIEQEDINEPSTEIEKPQEEYIEFLHNLQEESKKEAPTDREEAIEDSIESKEKH
jgi:hypothetical protein